MNEFISSGLFWLLLPVAAGSGWWVAQRVPRRSSRTVAESYPREYFRGLDYILNEQPDKAVELFTGMLERYADTTELHLVIGKLFRRCGELDRAIRVHQSLLSRSGLTEEQRCVFLHELGMDYLRAGLLDRAENLFRDAVEGNGPQVESSLDGLLEIYQQESDWKQAVRTARHLQDYRRQGIGAMIAQFYCEQAELAGGHVELVHDFLEQALAADPQCVRASLVEARSWAVQEQPGRAVSALQRVERQDVDFLPEIITPLQECYRVLDRPEDGMEYLRQVYNRHGNISLLLVLTRHMAETESGEAAMHYLAGELRRHPSMRGVQQLLAYISNISDDSMRDELDVVRELIDGFLSKESRYSCRQCGFRTQTLYWQCPSCRSWSQVKPLRERDEH